MEQESRKWYENKFLVHLLLILFFPVGLYGLWKSSTIAKWWKITATVIIGLIVLASLGSDGNFNATTNETQTKKEESATQSIQVQKDSNNEEKKITDELKAKAKTDWPNDYVTQEFWVKEQIEAYKYMKTIPNDQLKQQAQNDWPLDFVTQKFWYNEQVAAKERIN